MNLVVLLFTTKISVTYFSLLTLIMLNIISISHLIIS